MSEHQSHSSDDQARINEIVATEKKPRGNLTYQRAARPMIYDDEDEFNR